MLIKSFQIILTDYAYISGIYDIDNQYHFNCIQQLDTITVISMCTR